MIEMLCCGSNCVKDAHKLLKLSNKMLDRTTTVMLMTQALFLNFWDQVRNREVVL